MPGIPRRLDAARSPPTRSWTSTSACPRQQVASAWHKVLRLSLPNGWLAETNRSNLGPQLRKLARMARGKQPAPA